MFRISRITTNVRLDALGLPADALATLRTIAAKRTGTLLLTGPAGSGKSPVAEALAGTLGRDLMRVDISQVISRYIGETEKNLDRLFAVAAATNAVLFFDEADALLGQRSDVQDSHDRYANLEVSYLLQKLERHTGLTILATNARPRIDSGMLRRWRQVVELPWPPERR